MPLPHRFYFQKIESTSVSFCNSDSSFCSGVEFLTKNSLNLQYGWISEEKFAFASMPIFAIWNPRLCFNIQYFFYIFSVFPLASCGIIYGCKNAIEMRKTKVTQSTRQVERGKRRQSIEKSRGSVWKMWEGVTGLAKNSGVGERMFGRTQREKIQRKISKNRVF